MTLLETPMKTFTFFSKSSTPIAMKRNMKFERTLVTFLLMCGAFSFSFFAHGATGIVKGTVEFVRIHDAAWPDFAPPRFWFTLNGVTSAGACVTWTAGKIAFVSESKEAYAPILSAQITGKEVAVYFNDAITILGWCRAGYITRGNPPPLY